MWDVTGWALVTWFKLTVLFTVSVGVTWLIAGTDSGWFWLVLVVAVLGELFITRQLAREWLHEATFIWWWPR